MVIINFSANGSEFRIVLDKYHSPEVEMACKDKLDSPIWVVQSPSAKITYLLNTALIRIIFMNKKVGGVETIDLGVLV